MARDGRRRVPSLQSGKDRGIYCRGAPGRRDSLLRREQEPAELDLRRDRSLVSTLALHELHGVGRRSYRNTLALLRDVANRIDFERLPLIVTDGFDFYEKVVRHVFGPAALYGQVLKTRRNDRIVKVERRALMGASWRFEEALTTPRTRRR